MTFQRTAESSVLHTFLIICVVCFINGLISPLASAQTVDSQLDTITANDPPAFFNISSTSNDSNQAQLPSKDLVNNHDAALDQSDSNGVINPTATLPTNSTTFNETFQHVNQAQTFPKDQDLVKSHDASLNHTNPNIVLDDNRDHINNLAATDDSSEVPLHTKITVPFSVLGALLIVSGGPMCFWGGRNRWSSYFLTGAYLAAAIVMVPILRFGVIEQDRSPSNVVQGIFVLVCVISAVGAGAISVIFWKGTRFIVGAGGGFVISLFVLSLHSSATIRPLGLRYILILGCITVGFVLATIPAISLHVTLFATAAMGAAAVVLGIDCFTTGGLKEFWLYILGLGGLFPHLNYFPLTVTIQAELGVMAALFVMGAAIQWRLLEIIMSKIKELKQLDWDRKLEEEAAAYRQSMLHDADLTNWEKRHGDEDERKTARTSETPNSPLKDHRPVSKVSKPSSQRRGSKSAHSRGQSFSYELVRRLSDPFATSPPQPPLPSDDRSSFLPTSCSP